MIEFQKDFSQRGSSINSWYQRSEYPGVGKVSALPLVSDIGTMISSGTSMKASSRAA